ncbi:sphingosine N-acyltransferase lag1 [Metarhizium acridum]|nr:sphingosine N-acyltransferase lag1 [Metarhizium acridum]
MAKPLKTTAFSPCGIVQALQMSCTASRSRARDGVGNPAVSAARFALATLAPRHLRRARPASTTPPPPPPPRRSRDSRNGASGSLVVVVVVGISQRQSGSSSKRLSRRPPCARAALARAADVRKHTWVLPPGHALPSSSPATPSGRATQPSAPLHLPLVPAAAGRPLAAGPLRQGPPGRGLCGLLHRRALLHARVRHAGGAAAVGRAPRLRRKQAGALHGGAYTAVYFLLLGPAGVLVMSRTPVWYFNTRGMYEGFRTDSHEAPRQVLYLFQAAYWAQQAIVPRPGHGEAAATVLQGARRPQRRQPRPHRPSATASHFTYMGIAVYTTHDISDFFLATSKVPQLPRPPARRPPTSSSLSASGSTSATSLNLRILTSPPPCSPPCRPLNLFWLFYIVPHRLPLRQDSTADDDRSDDDDDADADDDEPAKPVPTLEINGKAVNGNSH